MPPHRIAHTPRHNQIPDIHYGKKEKTAPAEVEEAELKVTAEEIKEIREKLRSVDEEGFLAIHFFNKDHRRLLEGVFADFIRENHPNVTKSKKNTWKDVMEKIWKKKKPLKNEQLARKQAAISMQCCESFDRRILKKKQEDAKNGVTRSEALVYKDVQAENRRWVLRIENMKNLWKERMAGNGENKTTKRTIAGYRNVFGTRLSCSSKFVHREKIVKQTVYKSI